MTPREESASPGALDALAEAKRRIVALQDHVNGQPWDNAYVRGYNAATGNALAHLEGAAAALRETQGEPEREG